MNEQAAAAQETRTALKEALQAALQETGAIERVA